MAKGTQTATDILALILTGVSPSWLNSGFYISLHNADPTSTGNASVYETQYGNYSRVNINADAGSNGWTVSNGISINNGILLFPVCTGGTDIITNWSLTTAPGGPSQIIYTFPLSYPLSISYGVQPLFPVNALNISET
jgi:hypothetical protein